MNRSIMLALAGALLAGACSHMNLRSATAISRLAPTEGNQVQGTVHFTQVGDKVRVHAKVSGLTPGVHGFHIHEKGNCTAADGSSAGGHFNPRNSVHGAPDDPQHHAGDLGNLLADATGNATREVDLSGISLGTDADSIIGRAVIVHAHADDLRTQPAGNAGARQACGLISKSEDQWF